MPNESAVERVELALRRNNPKLEYGQAISVLEIGVADGMTARWLLEHICLDENSTYTGIDVKIRDTVDDLLDNPKVTLLEGPSYSMMKTLSGPFDIVHIDGAHQSFHVLSDSVMAWPMLKKGGLLMWDDYCWRFNREIDGRRELEHTVKIAVDAFLNCMYGNWMYRLIMLDSMFACIKKLQHGIVNMDYLNNVPMPDNLK